jgi:hypothetical protein
VYLGLFVLTYLILSTGLNTSEFGRAYDMFITCFEFISTCSLQDSLSKRLIKFDFILSFVMKMAYVW